MSNEQTSQQWTQAAASINAQIAQIEQQIDTAAVQEARNTAQILQLRGQLNFLPGRSAERFAVDQQIIALRDQNNQLILVQSQLTAELNPLEISLNNAISQATASRSGPPNTSVVPPPVPDDQSGTDFPVVPVVIDAAQVQAADFAAEQNRVEAERAAPVNDFVINAQGEQIPSDSAEAAEIRTEQVQTNAPAPAADPYSGLTPEQIELLGDADPTDPFIRARLGLPSLEEQPAVFAPVSVPGNFTAVYDPEGTAPNSWLVWNDDAGVPESTGLTEQEARIRAENLSLGSDEPIPQGTRGGTGLTPEEQAARDEAASIESLRNQATRQSVYKQTGTSDWRVRLQLAPRSTSLYNASPAGILTPLAATNGVIFPYTPAIQTTYRANYTNYDLVHSNFRGVFYQSSRVDDINIQATFTAQDTREADYLLATIHFFRSVTKMFYGQDAQRGTPPPLVYLSGLGMNQFFGHPCLVSAFQYSLPNNVDYIRATNVNNYGTDLLNRRTPSKSNAVAGGATGNRIANAGLEKFFPSKKPAPDSVIGTVNNTQLANYVPTKMEIDLVLIPVQTRSQVSKQFSLDAFASGDLIKKGFW